MCNLGEKTWIMSITTGFTTVKRQQHADLLPQEQRHSECRVHRSHLSASKRNDQDGPQAIHADEDFKLPIYLNLCHLHAISKKQKNRELDPGIIIDLRKQPGGQISLRQFKGFCLNISLIHEDLAFEHTSSIAVMTVTGRLPCLPTHTSETAIGVCGREIPYIHFFFFCGTAQHKALDRCKVLGVPVSWQLEKGKKGEGSRRRDKRGKQ